MNSENDKQIKVENMAEYLSVIVDIYDSLIINNNTYDFYANNNQATTQKEVHNS